MIRSATETIFSKLEGSDPNHAHTYNFICIRSVSQLFDCEAGKIVQSKFFTEQLRVAASVLDYS